MSSTNNTTLFIREYVSRENKSSFKNVLCPQCEKLQSTCITARTRVNVLVKIRNTN
uniref:Uncharacterized protein n=1 Tax=Anguilla anguilla TaxID=7936 RepID=A0A0E9WSN0_ANGAN